jgi:hypothetical protein
MAKKSKATHLLVFLSLLLIPIPIIDLPLTTVFYSDPNY